MKTAPHHTDATAHIQYHKLRRKTLGKDDVATGSRPRKSGLPWANLMR